MRITVETNVAAPIDQVWRAYTTPADIMKWNAASDDWHTTKATVDLREGGVFSSRMEAKDGSMGFDFAGTYTRSSSTSGSNTRSASEKPKSSLCPDRRAFSSALSSMANRRIRSSSSKAVGRPSSTISHDTWKRSRRSREGR